jgi:hypothetical protein
MAVGPAGKRLVLPKHSQKTAITPRLGSKSTLEPAVHAADLGVGYVPRRHVTKHFQTTVIKSVANHLICKCWGSCRRLRLNWAISWAAAPPPAI